jgi:hypothetical protein
MLMPKIFSQLEMEGGEVVRKENSYAASMRKEKVVQEQHEDISGASLFKSAVINIQGVALYIFK